MRDDRAQANAAEFVPARDDVFARIAGRYDRLCDLFSFGIHRYWKSRMAAAMTVCRAGVILDVAAGTGHIPERLVKRLARLPAKDRPERVIVTDLCPEMLAIARGKLGDQGGLLEYRLVDAHRLEDYEDASIDLLSIAFAMKICERDKVVAQARRVLRPGGWFFCLEASRIPQPIVQKAYLSYMNWCLPLMASLATGGDRSAYDYLLRGIHAFPDAQGFADELSAAGFQQVDFQYMTAGIVALHRAQQPG